MAQILKRNLFAMQVCVPADWDDESVIKFVEQDSPCGTENGWSVARDGDITLSGCAASVPCAERDGYVHKVVNA